MGVITLEKTLCNCINRSTSQENDGKTIKLDIEKKAENNNNNTTTVLESLHINIIQKKSSYRQMKFSTYEESIHRKNSIQLTSSTILFQTTNLNQTKVSKSARWRNNAKGNWNSPNEKSISQFT